MCKRCADKNEDARYNAFQPFFEVTWLSQVQATQAQKFMSEGAGADKTLHLEKTILKTEDEAKAKIAEMENDPTVARFHIEKFVVTLN